MTEQELKDTANLIKLCSILDEFFKTHPQKKQIKKAKKQ